ncbi:MAG: hypothetical protein KJ072_11280 [Verrucomicrobia bacterium]|nr:hypothetical protein [Verrucomicrobiota bacterium]
MEVAIARHFLGQFEPKEILEVGNVLSHYFPVSHTVVDKYEPGPGVVNKDILEFRSDRKYRLILSISTFEHIGYDDAVGDGSRKKILQALASCRTLLAGDGKLMITVPIGYNPELDEMISDGSLGAGKQWFLRRISRRTWVPCDWSALAGCRYGQPYPYANGIMAGEF